MKCCARFHSILVFLFALTVVPGNTHAREVSGVSFSETKTIAGTTCGLNGVGMRKKLIIKVYLGALYLEHTTQNSGNIISSEQVKQVHMHFLYRKVTQDQLVEAWNEGFEKNSGDSISALKGKINTFNGFFTEPVKKGETITITYVPGKGTEVVVKNVVKGVIEGHDFMEAMFSIWFGPYPPSKGLREGMLGE